MKRLSLVFLLLVVLIVGLWVASTNPRAGKAAPNKAIPWWLGDYEDDFYHEYACVDGMNLWVLAIEGDGSENPTFSIEGYVIDSGLEVVNETLPFQFFQTADPVEGAPYAEYTIHWSQDLQPGTVVEFIFYSDVFVYGPNEPYVWRAYIRDCTVPTPPVASQFRMVFAREFYDGEWDDLGIEIPAGGCSTETRLIGVARNFVIADADVSIKVISDEPATLSATLTSPNGTAVKIMEGNHDPVYDFGGTDEEVDTYTINVAGAQRDWKWPGYANSLIFDDASVYDLVDMAEPYVNMVVKPWPDTLSAFNGEESAGEWHLEICNSMPSGNAMLQKWAIILEQDTTPPVINGLVATVLSESSAVIEWQTDEPADSHVFFGTTSGVHPLEESNGALVTEHAVTLTGLTPGTTYYFKVSSADGAGNIAQSQEESFETESGPVAYSLTVTTNGQGTVQTNPNKPTYQNGEVVTLTAIPDNGHQFAGWSGNASGTANPIQITMNGNKSVTASFTPVIPNTYTLTTPSSTGGYIDRNPDKPTYQSGEVVTLTAAPASGYQFGGWNGDASGMGNPIQITMDSNKSVGATFLPIGTSDEFLYFIAIVLN